VKHIQLLVNFNSNTKHSLVVFLLDIYLTSQSFLPFTSLHTLSIDSTYLTNELLQCFAQQPTPLKR
jgi:hypothetical protein